MKNSNRKLLISSLLIFLNLFYTSCRKQTNINIQGKSSFKNSGSVSIKVMSHNVYLLNEVFFSTMTLWSQHDRAVEISKASYFEDYDVLLLQELFDNKASDALKDGLLSRFPYQTPIMGRSREGWDQTEGSWREDILSGGVLNGGCLIVSKYPITYMVQFIYPIGCSYDGLASKGFIYATIKKDGHTIHLINTHLQSTQSSCFGYESTYRLTQLHLIKEYLDDLNIPKNELVILGGDFNVVKGTGEYRKMLRILEVTEPHYVGVPYSWDTKTNTMVSYHFPYPEYEREHLDYIFISKNHLQPPVWQNLTLDPVSSTLMSYKNVVGNEFHWVEYADHFPIAAFIYADEKTPTYSLRYRPYDKVSFKSVVTEKYVNSNLEYPRDWLRVSDTARTQPNSWFNLMNITKDEGSYFELRPGDIRVETSERLNHFWYWTNNLSGAYYYYPEFGKRSYYLTLKIVTKQEGNNSELLEDGDIVAFNDIDSYYSHYDYFIQVYKHDGEHWMYLNGKKLADRAEFKVEFNQKEPDSWKDDLIYK